MRTLYLRNVPDEVAAGLEEIARAESLSVNALAVRELTNAVAFRSNVDLFWSQPRMEVRVEDVVDAIRAGRDR